MISVHINVTRQHIEQAEKCLKSPILLAVEEYFPKVVVTKDRLLIVDKNENYLARYMLPSAVRFFVKSYNEMTYKERTMYLDPISFVLELPEIVLETIDISDIMKTNSKKNY